MTTTPTAATFSAAVSPSIAKRVAAALELLTDRYTTADDLRAIAGPLSESLAAYMAEGLRTVAAAAAASTTSRLSAAADVAAAAEAARAEAVAWDTFRAGLTGRPPELDPTTGRPYPVVRLAP